MLVSSVQWIKGSWVFVGVVGFVTLYGWFGGAQRLYTYALSMQTYDCIWDCDNIHEVRKIVYLLSHVMYTNDI